MLVVEHWSIVYPQGYKEPPTTSTSDSSDYSHATSSSKMIGHAKVISILNETSYDSMTCFSVEGEVEHLVDETVVYPLIIHMVYLAL